MNKNIVKVCGVVGVIGCVLYAQPPAAAPNDPPPPKICEVSPFGHQGMADFPGGPRQPPMILDIAELQKQLEEINISKLVTEKIVAIARNFLSALDDRLIKVQREELNIREELLKEKPDLKAIQGFIVKKTQVFSEIEFLQIKRDLEIKSLLTPEEYDRWKSAMAQKMRHMMPPPPMENGPGGPGMPGNGGPECRKPIPPKQ